MDNESQFLDEHFKTLPQVVQDAITGAAVEAHLRELSKKHNLHVDQWQELETEVMTALMGLKPVSSLEQNIKKYVRVDNDTARALAEDISRVVFIPIRSALDRFLLERRAPAKEGEPMKDLSDDVLQKAGLHSPTVFPTPEHSGIPHAASAQTSEQKTTVPPPSTVVRREVPETYKPGTQSTVRKDVLSDPYRESPDV